MNLWPHFRTSLPIQGQSSATELYVSLPVATDMSLRKLVRWNPYFTSKYETEFVTWFARAIRITEFIVIALIK
jgi:hypothetical protein